MNKLPEAADALRQAIRLESDFAGAHTTLAAVLRQLGDTAGAAAESQAGAEISKKKNRFAGRHFATNSGRRLRNAGDLEGAISQFQAAIRAMPSYALAHYELGVALSQKGQKDEAAGSIGKLLNWTLNSLLLNSLHQRRRIPRFSAASSRPSYPNRRVCARIRDR